ncbi:MAG: PAS domain-containing protein [Pseudomonadales bacterium]
MDEPNELIREHLQLIYDNTRDLVFLIEVGRNRDYRVVSVNPAYLERTQLHRDRVVGRPIEDVLRDDHLEYVRSRYDEAVACRGLHRYETRTTLRGETIYLDTTLVPVFDADGRCTHLIGVSRDISDNKRERQALRHEKQRAENYLDIAEALILALDRDATVTLLNRKGYDMLGYPEGSLLGRNWCELCIAPDKRTAFMARLRRAIDAGEVGRNINYVATSSGERRLINWANALIHNDDGDVVGVLSSGEDITDRRLAEQAMIASQRVLAANEVAAAVAHDFNNSLQGILGNIELALVSDEDEALRAHLDTAAKLADDAARRLQVLRGTSAGASGDGEVLDLNELIDDVIAQTQPL